MYVLVWCIICTRLGVWNWTGVLYEGEGRDEALTLHLY